MGLAQEALEILQCPIRGMDVGVIGDVVPIVPQRRGAEGQEPNGRYSKIFQEIKLLRQAAEVADAIGVAVGESAHVHFVDDGVLVPRHTRGQSHDVQS